jgi:beta-N-acetylhexosaminidase
MFLFTKDLDEDIAYMMAGLESGVLSEARLNEAVTRILAVKAALGLPEKKASGTLLRDSSGLGVLGSPTHLEWAAACADRGVTLVKDTQNLLPLNALKHRRVLLETLGDSASSERVTEHFERLLTAEGFNVTRYVPETFENIFIETSVEKFKSKYDLVFYIGNIENASSKTVSRINWHTLFGAGNNLPWFVNEVPALFVSVGNPYHLNDVPMIKTFINGYCHAPAVIEAIMDKLLGRGAFTGKSPVDPFCGKWDAKF